jgi:hypothetical protein
VCRFCMYFFSPQTDSWIWWTDSLKHSGYYITPVLQISGWWNSVMSPVSSGSNLPCWRTSYVFIIRVLMSEPSEPWWCTQELITETVDWSHLTLSACKDFIMYVTHTHTHTHTHTGSKCTHCISVTCNFSNKQQLFP